MKRAGGCLVSCFAGCTFEDVRTALGLDRLHQERRIPGPSPTTGSRAAEQQAAVLTAHRAAHWKPKPLPSGQGQTPSTRTR